MFPSGRWRGFWEQAGFGRQEMHDLVLEFSDDGIVAGEGWDCVGQFTFQGSVDEQYSVSLAKQYVGAHSVQYQGSYDGEGTIFGHWYLGPLSDKFALTPVRSSHPAADEIQELS